MTARASVRVIAAAGSASLAAVLGFLAFAVTQVPMPAQVGVSDLIGRTLRGAVAEFQVRVLGGDAELAGGQELLRLDPTLTKATGRTGASVVIASSSDMNERLAALNAAFASRKTSTTFRVRLLSAFLRRPASASALRSTLRQAAHLASNQRGAVGSLLIKAVLRTKDPTLLDAAAVAAGWSAVGSSEATNVARAIVKAPRPDLFDNVVQLAPRMRARDRRAVSESMLDSSVAAAMNQDWKKLTSLALAVDRNAVTLNQRGVQADNYEEALASFAEARQLDPNSSTIAANWAAIKKLIAIRDRDHSVNMTELDGLLDAGLALDSNAAGWKQVRQLTMPSYYFGGCSCSC